MLVPAMRNYYALRSLDEIYQAVWRTAVRNDQPVEAVIVVPDPHWLAALYRTVMPQAVIVSAYEDRFSTATVELPAGTLAYNNTLEDGTYVIALKGPDGKCKCTVVPADGSPVYANDITETMLAPTAVLANGELCWSKIQIKSSSMELKFDFELNRQLYGMGVCAIPPGTEITKKELANALGYREWERNKERIMNLVGDFFELGSNVRKLRRKGRS